MPTKRICRLPQFPIACLRAGGFGRVMGLYLSSAKSYTRFRNVIPHPQRRVAVLMCVTLLTLPLSTVVVREPEKHREIWQPRPPSIDSFGDPLPAGAVFRIGTIRAKHEIVSMLRYSADGKAMAGLDHRGTADIWESATGRNAFSVPGTTGPVRCLAFARVGSVLATGESDGTIRLWKCPVGTLLRRISGHGPAVRYLAFGPNDGWLASYDGKELRFWDVVTGKPLRHLHADNHNASTWVDLSADGTYLTVTFTDFDARSETECIWNTVTGQLISFRAPKRFFPCTVFLPGGKSFLSSNVDGWTVRDLPTRKETARLEIHGFPIAVSPDGKTLASFEPEVNPRFLEQRSPLRLWDLTTGRELSPLRSVRDGVFAVAFAPDSKTLASIGRDRTLRLWDVTSGRELDVPVGHQHSVTTLTFSPDGQFLVSASADRTIRLWRALTGQGSGEWKTEQEIVRELAFAADAKTLLSESQVVRPLDFDPQHRSLDRVRAWDVNSGSERSRFDVPRLLIRKAAFSADRQIVAIADNKEVHMFAARTGAKVRSVAVGGETDSITDIAFSPQSNLLIVAGTYHTFNFGSGTALSLWEVATGRRLWQQLCPLQGALAMSPDGKFLGTQEDRSYLGTVATLWDVTSGQRVASFAPPDNDAWHESASREFVHCLVFSPDGKMIATHSPQGYVDLWEVATRKLRHRFAGHWISCLAFSPDGRLLASGGVDTLVMVWDVTGRMERGRLRQPPADRKELAAAWTALSDSDARAAYDAVWRLVSDPDNTIPWAKEHWSQSSETRIRIDRLIAALDDDDFATRQKATAELTALGQNAALALRERLAAKPSLEVRNRVQALLRRIPDTADANADIDFRRNLRLLEVLEQIGTPSAAQVLRDIAQRGRERRLRDEATASLQRLAHRTVSSSWPNGN
jgi:WD40 repeat protein